MSFIIYCITMPIIIIIAASACLTTMHCFGETYEVPQLQPVVKFWEMLTGGHKALAIQNS